ncbi:MAG: hypothetical protein CMH61_01760 [Nanoarchaeota archaeon]|nr:hypothetical protein [Nanoarchaeota archaeon]|tara:strand:+ start:1591 stop:2838 length:1248 start_codon:yes stop_codon:yes gene_type:complete
MKKIVISCLLVLVTLLIVGCAEEMTDDQLDVALGEMSDEDLELAMIEEDSALAGNAKYQKYQSANPKKAKRIKVVSYSAKKKKKTRTYTCSDDGEEIVIKRDGREIRRRAKFYCFGGNVKERYCRAERGSSFWRVYGTRISDRCEAGEECREAQCVSLCGNGAVDEGETCSSCPADVSCGEGQECQNNECVAVEVEAQGEGQFCYYIDSEGNRMQEGQAYPLGNFVDGITDNLGVEDFDYRGVETEEGLFTNQCHSNDERVFYEVCGEENEQELFELGGTHISGIGVERGEPIDDGCLVGCNQERGHCCDVVSRQSGRCEANNAVITYSTADCGLREHTRTCNPTREICFTNESLTRSGIADFGELLYADCVSCDMPICERDGLTAVLNYDWQTCNSLRPEGSWRDTFRRSESCE